DEVRDELARYDNEWERQLADDAGYANELINQFTPLVAHATLTQFVEAYFVVAEVAAMTSHTDDLTLERCVQECFVHGRQAYRRRLISSEASIGKLLFQNGYRWLASRGLCGPGGPELTEKRLQTRDDVRELMRRLQKVQALALPSA
ncbi:MAG: glycerol-3-phosphate acyltransferase, partial [Woeseiaceae bacterium]|nr:glycerol-3-phosphate acyltransferase [Woeseiaceae bacterium]